VSGSSNHNARPVLSQTDLFGDATANRGRVHISSKLFGDLGLGEPHRLRRLQCGGDSP
jgi:hypothetical protein